MKEVTVKIREDGIVTVEDEKDGVKTFKPISPDSLLKCISRSAFQGGVASGLLPKGCISFSTFDNGDRRVCLVHQESYADVSYYDTAYPSFPLPRLVFGFNINTDGRIVGCDMGITENADFLKPTTAMYHYPFSNVSGFRLCTGNNVLPKCGSLHTLGSLAYYILSMANNNDHFSAKLNQQRLEMRDLFELLKNKTPEFYYSDILIQSRAKLDDFINGRNVL